MSVSLKADCNIINLMLQLHICGGLNACVTCECVEQVAECKYLTTV